MLLILQRAGVSFKVDNQLPNFVNLNEDPQLSELLLYVIKRGVTRCVFIVVTFDFILLFIVVLLFIVIV